MLYKKELNLLIVFIGILLVLNVASYFQKFINIRVRDDVFKVLKKHEDYLQSFTYDFLHTDETLKSFMDLVYNLDAKLVKMMSLIDTKNKEKYPNISSIIKYLEVLTLESTNISEKDKEIINEINTSKIYKEFSILNLILYAGAFAIILFVALLTKNLILSIVIASVTIFFVIATEIKLLYYADISLGLIFGKYKKHIEDQLSK